jgi:hypothetical protein
MTDYIYRHYDIEEKPLHNLMIPHNKYVKEDAAGHKEESEKDLIRRIVQYNPTYSLDDAGKAIGVSGQTVKKWKDKNEK